MNKLFKRVVLLFSIAILFTGCNAILADSAVQGAKGLQILHGIANGFLLYAGILNLFVLIIFSFAYRFRALFVFKKNREDFAIYQKEERLKPTRNFLIIVISLTIAIHIIYAWRIGFRISIDQYSKLLIFLRDAYLAAIENDFLYRPYLIGIGVGLAISFIPFMIIFLIYTGESFLEWKKRTGRYQKKVRKSRAQIKEEKREALKHKAFNADNDEVTIVHSEEDALSESQIDEPSASKDIDNSNISEVTTEADNESSIHDIIQELLNAETAHDMNKPLWALKDIDDIEKIEPLLEFTKDTRPTLGIEGNPVGQLVFWSFENVEDNRAQDAAIEAIDYFKTQLKYALEGQVCEAAVLSLEKYRDSKTREALLDVSGYGYNAGAEAARILRNFPDDEVIAKLEKLTEEKDILYTVVDNARDSLEYINNITADKSIETVEES